MAAARASILAAEALVAAGADGGDVEDEGGKGVRSRKCRLRISKPPAVSASAAPAAGQSDLGAKPQQDKEPHAKKARVAAATAEGDGTRSADDKKTATAVVTHGEMSGVEDAAAADACGASDDEVARRAVAPASAGLARMSPMPSVRRAKGKRGAAKAPAAPRAGVNATPAPKRVRRAVSAPVDVPVAGLPFGLTPHVPAPPRALPDFAESPIGRVRPGKENSAAVAAPAAAMAVFVAAGAPLAAAVAAVPAKKRPLADVNTSFLKVRGYGCAVRVVDRGDRETRAGIPACSQRSPTSHSLFRS